MKKTLPSIKVKEQVLENMKSALKKHNEENISILTLQEFRRLSYEFFSRIILLDVKLPIKLIRS